MGMFSARTEWDFQPNTLTSLLAEKRLQREEILDLTESNPTRCGFDYQPQYTLEALSTRRSLVYEPHPKGILSARSAVAEYYARQGIDVNPDHIILTAGTSEAYTFLLRLLCNGRDSVALVKPGYPLLEYLCQMNDVVGRHVHLQYDQGWHLDLDALKVELAARAKAVALVHPNNPTGSAIRHHEREAIVTAVNSTGAALLVDEVFHPFQGDATTPLAPSFASNRDCLTFTMNGISKLLGLPQFKLAWIVVSGPPAEVEVAVARLEMIGDLFLSVSTPIQQALPVLLQDPAGLTGQIKERVGKNRANLSAKSDKVSAVELLGEEGGWYAVLRLPRVRTDEEWAHLFLKDLNILVHPGCLFDFEDEAIVVVSLLQKEEIFQRAVEGVLSMVDV